MASSSCSMSNVQQVYQIDKLTNVNYAIWSIKMEILLMRSELSSLINSDEVNFGHSKPIIKT